MVTQEEPMPDAPSASNDANQSLPEQIINLEDQRIKVVSLDVSAWAGTMS